ncbi:hypothetical protein [Azospirillum brasilense]|uniref:hypothetical protein n=1 Tax=Azospirillum brasilense TaxID=192 RepID=UPI0013B3C31C|nr:hypothetical protein [Azospirillum brasilense]
MSTSDFEQITRTALVYLEKRLNIKAAFELSKFRQIIALYDQKSDGLEPEVHPALAAQMLFFSNPLDTNRAYKHYNAHLAMVVGLLMSGKPPNTIDIEEIAKKSLQLHGRGDLTDFYDFLSKW